MAIELAFGVCPAADGSALVRTPLRPDGSAGDVAFRASVHGPAPPRTRAEDDAEAAVLAVDFEPLDSAPGLAANAAAHLIERVLSRALLLPMHPRAVFALAVRPVSAPAGLRAAEDLGALAAAINAGAAALLDCGAPMRGVPVAVCGADGATLAVYEHRRDECGGLVTAQMHVQGAPHADDAALRAASAALFAEIERSVHALYVCD